MCREINICMPKLETSNPYFSFLNSTLETSLGVLDLSENVCYGAKPSVNIYRLTSCIYFIIIKISDNNMSSVYFRYYFSVICLEHHLKGDK